MTFDVSHALLHAGKFVILQIFFKILQLHYGSFCKNLNFLKIKSAERGFNR